MKINIIATCISVLCMYSIPVLSASIELVNGNLITGSTNTPISPDSFGLFTSEDFSYADTVLDSSGTIGNSQIAHALTTVDIMSTGFDIKALSEGGFYYNSSYQEDWANLSVQGNLLFNVIGDGSFEYSWNNGIYNPYDYSDTRIILKNSSGYEILNCSSYLLCLNPMGTDLQSVNGSILLTKGEYQLTYTANVALVVGTSIYADMDFSLQITSVPLPATIWLFGSGLLGLFGSAIRRNYLHQRD